MTSLKLLTILAIALLISASACLASATAWRILRAVGVNPFSLTPIGVRWILEAGSQATDPRVPGRLRTQVLLAQALGFAGFLIASIGLALDGRPDGAVAFGAIALLSLGGMVRAFMRFRDIA